MKFEPLRIGDLVATIPVIQGGMGVGVSLSRLAGNVAKEGGIGVISTAQIGFLEADYDTNPHYANLRVVQAEIRKAREIAEGGIIGVNIMVATKGYEEYVKAAVEAGVDLIISGAGLPVTLPNLVGQAKTKLAPIVSSVKSTEVIFKYWLKKWKRLPDLVVIEGPRAGGHLGFSMEQLKEEEIEWRKEATEYEESIENGEITEKKEMLQANKNSRKEIKEDKICHYDKEIKDIITCVNGYGQQVDRNIPVIIAGGIYNATDAKHYMDMGAAGVQMGTRFVTTEECDASDAYKQTYLKAKEEDIILVKSPVGMPGRAIRNEFMKKAEEGQIPHGPCHGCVSTCKPALTPYCITEGLIQAVTGNVEQGLLFCGTNAYRANKIETVKEIMSEFR